MRQAACLLFLILALGIPSWAEAHYHMLLPSTAFAKKGEAITLTCQWGHPHEHQLSDAAKPANLSVVQPDGKVVNLTKDLEKVELAGPKGSKSAGWRVKFTPEERGDYLFVLQAAPLFLEED